jgi:hypothetical protein
MYYIRYGQRYLRVILNMNGFRNRQVHSQRCCFRITLPHQLLTSYSGSPTDGRRGDDE